MSQEWGGKERGSYVEGKRGRLREMEREGEEGRREGGGREAERDKENGYV